MATIITKKPCSTVPGPAAHPSEARRLSLSFLYWLQTEAPHDDQRRLPGLGAARSRWHRGWTGQSALYPGRGGGWHKRVLERDIITAGVGRGRCMFQIR